jgi:hypothetical protein
VGLVDSEEKGGGGQWLGHRGFGEPGSIMPVVLGEGFSCERKKLLGRVFFI